MALMDMLPPPRRSRRQYLDHVIVFGEAYLRRTLKYYADCHNRV